MSEHGSAAWHADDGTLAVPVARPLLPDTDAVLPYLREIDATRRYTNNGPLVHRFEARLAATFGAVPEQIAVCASGTAALTAILRSFEIEPGRTCMIPGWTFAATAHAAVDAGLIPWIVDVDPAGVLTPELALDCLARSPAAPAAVIVVAPFGLPAEPGPWLAFSERTGIPVVVDAAAGFDSARASAIPTMVSLHATKVLGIGEGGLALCSDAARIRRIQQHANFGFAGSRESARAGTNAKLAEYAAAVGLAAIDGWPAAREDFARVANAYRAAFANTAIALPHGYGERWISGTACVTVPPGRLEAVEGALGAHGIGTRRWWGDGLGAHRAFARYPCTPLPVVAALAGTTLGLPCRRDLPSATVAEIARLVIAACAGDV